MKQTKFKLFIAFLAVYLIADSAVAQESTWLDGKSYSVSLTTIGKNKDASWNSDTFIFEDGEMYPSEMKKREGFKRALCSPEKSGTDKEPIVKFKYEKSNKYGSSLVIEGTAKANSIEGTATWTDDNGEHQYTFTGTLLVP